MHADLLSMRGQPRARGIARWLAGAWLLFVLLVAAPARAQTTPAMPGITSAQAQHLVDVLEDPAKRDALLQTLRELAATVPADPPAPASATPPVAVPAIPGPVAAAAAAPPPSKAAAAPASAPLKIADALKPGSLGDELIGQTSDWIETISEEATATTKAIVQMPGVLYWARRIVTDPFLRWRVLDAAGKLALIAVIAVAVQYLVAIALRPLLRLVERGLPGTLPPAADPAYSAAQPTRARAAATSRLIRRLPGASLRLLLRLLRVATFALCAYFLLGTGLVTLLTTRVIVLDAVKATVIFFIVVNVASFLFSEKAAEWRLLEVSDGTATYAQGWIGWLAGVAIFGGTAAAIAAQLGLSPAAHEGLLKMVALICHVWLVVVIWRGRKIVARRLHLRSGASALWAGIMHRLASTWHYFASALVMALWLVWAVQAQNGVQRVVGYFVVTLGVLIGMRIVQILALGALDRAFHLGPDPTKRPAVLATRAGRYYPVLRQFVRLGLYLLGFGLLLQFYGADVLGWFAVGAVGIRLLSASTTVLIIAVLALLCWELANATIDRHLQRLTSTGRYAQAGRLRTLAPLVRTCLLTTILVVVTLTALSELGVNIAPLLAGAGIFGVAIGFGSQKLVQDFITGIFLLLENAMQVGEWVTVSGLSGTVENLSIRTIRLRAGDGSVHVIPFSSVTTVTNINRGIGNAPVSVTVSIDEDTDHVGEVLKQIGDEMRADPLFRRGIRSDLALWGVDKVDASTVTIVGQIECTDDARWGVQREFYRRLKKRFQELGIVLANPAQAVLVEEAARIEAKVAEAKVAAPADPGESSASVTQSPPSAALGHAA